MPSRSRACPQLGARTTKVAAGHAQVEDIDATITVQIGPLVVHWKAVINVSKDMPDRP